MNKNIVICDPYNYLLSEELIRRDYKITAVLSSQDILPAYKQFNPNIFTEILYYDISNEECIEKLKELNPIAIFPGCDAGVTICSQLCEKLNLECNPSNTAMVKRDKYLMSETLREKNIPAVKQVLVSFKTNIDEAISKIGEFPIIIKPINSCSTDGVKFCNCREEVFEAVNKLLNTTNALNIKNETILMQEYLGNMEYVVDFVVLNDTIHTTAIWKYDKVINKDGDVLCYSAELIKSTGEEQDILTEYGKKVVKALDFKIGPAHCEIILTKRGPILVEVGARLHGGTAVKYSTICSGKGQLEYTIEAYIDKEKFIETSKTPYELNKHCKLCFLLYNNSGILREINYIQEIKELPSFYKFNSELPVEGKKVKKSKDIINIGAVMTLIHEDEEQLKADYKKLRNFNDTDLFVIA